MNEYFIIDNFFEKPEKVLEISNKQKFYLPEEHPYNIFNFPGVRTTYINEFDYDLFEYIRGKVLKSISDFTDINIKEYSTWHWFSFSKTFSNINDSLPLWHKDFDNDGCLYYVGVCYLNKNPPEDTGTIIKGKENYIVENRFNRFLIYSNDYIHSCQGSFDNRLVLTHATKLIKK